MPKKAAAPENKDKKNEILKESFVDKELLNASVIQRELMGTIEILNANLKELNNTLTLIREHEFVEFHKSKWKIFAHQILLGMLFAVGTVLGLVLLSWVSYNVLKDSTILRDIVNRQLQMRNFNLDEIKDKALQDATNSGKSATGSGTGASK